MAQRNIVFVGRLEKDTGLLKFLLWLKKNNINQVDFCGDGTLRTECEKYGVVHGFCDPKPFYKKADICVPGGYLSALEALNYECKLKLFWDSPIKRDYWKLSPFPEADSKWVKSRTWDKVTNLYLKLWGLT
ncbi:MAG: hypothetical protein AAB656_03990 [Patescibacteria group bacterium]